MTCEHLGSHMGDVGAWDLSSSRSALMISNMIVEVGGIVRRADDLA